MTTRDATRQQRGPGRPIRDPHQSRGSALFFGLMALSVATLIYLGAITTTLNGQLWVENVRRSSTAIQLAHSGVEYALWEINYGGNDFQAPDWTDPNTGAPPCTTLCRYLKPLGGGQQQFAVTVNKTPDANGNWTLTAGGTNQATTRTVTVTVPARSQPGLFDHVLYTAGGDRNDANIYLNPHVIVDAYNSNNGYYGFNGNVFNNKAVVRTDSKPTSDPMWASSGTPQTAGAIVLDGASALGPKAQVRGILRLRKRATSEPLGSDLDSGYVLYPAPMNPTNHGPLIDIIDGSDPGVSDQPLSYQPKDGPSSGATDLAPLAGTTANICPGDTKTYSQVMIAGATLVIGCTNNPSDPDYATASCALAAYAGCATRDPAQKVTIATGNGADGGPGTPYALRVQSHLTPGAFPLPPTETPGRIIVYSPTDLYYTPSGAKGNGTYYGLDIESKGIENRIFKSPGNPDPSQLAIYGDKDSPPDASSFMTATPFHGVVFSPRSSWTFNTSALTFSGALNVQQIIVTDNGVASKWFHWDEALKQAYPPAQGGSPNCTPNPGSWTLQ